MKTLAFIALISMAYFVVSIVVLHFLRSDINPIKQATGYYAIGPHRLLMTSAFFSVGLASLIVAVGLYKGTVPSARSLMGLVLLGIWVIGVLIATCFPLNPEGTPMTVLNRIRRISTPFTFLCLTLGVMLVSRSFKFDENWYPIYRLSFVLSWLMLVLFITTVVNVLTRSDFLGLLQRISLATFAIWFLVVAVRLMIIGGSG